MACLVMTDETGKKPELRPPTYPDGYLFPDELITRWIEMPQDQPLVIGPLTKTDLDHLLFSTSDMARAVAELREAIVTLHNGQPDSADIHLRNSFAAATDAETRSRLLFKAIIESILKVGDAGK
jgi:hypothetical protein